MKTNKISFGVFVNQPIGVLVKANNLVDLLKNKLSKKLLESWSHIMFKDEDGNSVQISREFLEEQKMSLAEIVNDWMQHGDLNEDIIVLNPNGSGTLTL